MNTRRGFFASAVAALGSLVLPRKQAAAKSSSVVIESVICQWTREWEAPDKSVQRIVTYEPALMMNGKILSPACAATIMDAHKIASALGDDYIGNEHLLFAMSNGRGFVADIEPRINVEAVAQASRHNMESVKAAVGGIH